MKNGLLKLTVLKLAFLLILSSTCHATDYTNDANCAGAWLMEDTGNETDACGNGETAVETSGTIPTSSDVPSGYSGTSRDFEAGDTEELVVSDGNEIDISGADAQISIVTWIKAESITGDNRSLLDKYDVTANNRHYQLWIDDDPDDTVVFTVSSDGSSFDGILGTTTISLDTWYHVAVVSNDTDIRIYIDGSSDATPVSYTSGLHNGSEDLYIGAGPGSSSDHFDGLMDESAVFDRDLSSVEVNEIMDNGLEGNFGGVASLTHIKQIMTY